MFYGCLPCPEIEKAEGSLWGTRCFFISEFFYVQLFWFSPDVLLIFQGLVRISRQHPSQNRRKALPYQQNREMDHHYLNLTRAG